MMAYSSFFTHTVRILILAVIMQTKFDFPIIAYKHEKEKEYISTCNILLRPKTERNRDKQYSSFSHVLELTKKQNSHWISFIVFRVQGSLQRRSKNITFFIVN